MKKIILLPRTDTVTLFLPEKWVGVPIVCRLTPISDQFINHEDVEREAERVIIFLNKQKRKKNK
jgi:hypothetical protein